MADFLSELSRRNIEDNDPDGANERENERKRLQTGIQRKLPNRMENRSLFGVRDPEELEKIKNNMRSIVREMDTSLPTYEIENLLDKLLAEITSLGKIAPLMEDDTITEIMINSYDEIWVEQKSQLVKTDYQFNNEKELMELAQRIARNVGRSVDNSNPHVDARLPDGSRVHIIIPPLSKKGVTITIRKFFRERLSIEDLIEFETLTPDMSTFLQKAVEARSNILVSGGTGSGKTTTLNVLSNFISGNERVITIEDSAELQLNSEHIVSLETKDANSEGKGLVTIQDLVKESLRMNPSRIIVGEVRDETAYDLLNAMSTGHDGSMSTIHANDPDNAVMRLTNLVLQKSLGLAVDNVTDIVGQSIDLIVQISKMKDGKRRIEYISQVIYDINSRKLKIEPIYIFTNGKFIRTENEITETLLRRFEKEGIEI